MDTENIHVIKCQHIIVTKNYNNIGVPTSFEVICKKCGAEGYATNVGFHNRIIWKLNTLLGK